MVTVLLVEDEAVILKEVATWLEFEGYEVVTASNGQEGFEAALQHLPQVIICDMRMPVMNGRELLKAIRANDTVKHIPFIFATASAEKDSIAEGLELGANAYIVKPFEMDNILTAVTEWADKSN